MNKKYPRINEKHLGINSNYLGFFFNICTSRVDLGAPPVPPPTAA